MQRLKSFYFKEVVPILSKTYNYTNFYQIPKLKKIVINRGFDESCQNSKVLDLLIAELSLITGQHVVVTRSKNSIANFKIRENMPVGMSVTLRGEKMYSFFDRLVNLSLPRIKDFNGVSNQSFDGNGNYSLSLSDQLMFPEVNYDQVVKIEGMDIVVVTTAYRDEEAFFLLKQLGMPFRS